MHSPADKPHVQISSERQEYAWVNADNVVVNVVVGDADFAKRMTPEGLRAIKIPAHPSVGWLYKNGRFEPPVDETA